MRYLTWLGNLYMIDVAIRHSVWGVLLLFTATPTMTTPLNALTYLVHDHRAEGVVLIVAAILFVVGLKNMVGVASRWGIVFYGLQQFLILIAAAGPIMAIWNGYYADLEPRPRAFIFADQYPHVQVAVFHSVALYLWNRYNTERQTLEGE